MTKGAPVRRTVRQLSEVPEVRRIAVLMTSTSYPASLADWRGLFMRHLADALARRDDLCVSLWGPPGDTHPRIARVSTPGEDAMLAKLMHDGGIAHLLRNRRMRTLPAAAALLGGLRRSFQSNSSDIYHLNWLQCALPLPRDGKPALITVLGSDMKLLQLPMMAPLLRRALRGRQVAICPNADWMVDGLQRAFGDLARIATVPFGIDPRWFQLRRSCWDEEQAHWLVVSRLTRDKLGPLFEWCAPLFNDGRNRLHLFGPMQEVIELPSWVDYHGPATPDQLCNEWFPRARGLLSLSRHSEGRPQVMLESMAAAIPIIASRIAGHENLLDDGITGCLVDSSQQLRSALERLADPVENRRIGEAARSYARADVGTWDDCAQRYAAIYTQLIAASPAR